MKLKVKGKFNSWCVYVVKFTIYIISCTPLLSFNFIYYAHWRFRDCNFKNSTGFQRLSGGLGVCNTAIGPDKNNCCVPLLYICYYISRPRKLHCSSHVLSTWLRSRKNDSELKSTVVDMGVGRRLEGGSLALQYDESSHSMRKPSLRLSSEINKFCRLVLPSWTITVLLLQEEGGHCLCVSMETILGQSVCLGKGCGWRTSPSNQLEYSAETAGLILG